jgi:hypothetical protein
MKEEEKNGCKITEKNKLEEREERTVNNEKKR